MSDDRSELEHYIKATNPVEQRIPEPVVVPLDAYVDVIEALAEAKRMIAFWKGEEGRAKKRLAEVLGEAEVGTINGEWALTFKYEDRFRSEDFRKAYPDMYKLYTREVVSATFDLESFRRSRPELYHEFQVRSMKRTGSKEVG